MDRRDVLRRISTFPLLARNLAEDILSGAYRSVFKGQGIEFDEVRHYQSGDDVRSIDWNVSARFGTPYVKMYREEREVAVCILLDISASMHTTGGSTNAASAAALPPVMEVNRYEQAVLALALVAFSAEAAGQPLSVIFFDKEIQRIIPPRKGRRHTMSAVSAALDARSSKKGSDLGKALSGAGRLLQHRSLVIVISDFMCTQWENELGKLAQHHDIIAVNITAPLDTEMPDSGFLAMEDPETGIKLSAPSSFKAFRSAWTSWHEERFRHWEGICRRWGIAHVELSTSSDATAVFKRFFRRENASFSGLR